MNWKILLDYIFPRECTNCGKALNSDSPLCAFCASEVKINSSMFCGQCRARLPSNKKICHKDFPYILGAATNYMDEPVKSVVHALKFKNQRSSAIFLAELCSKYLSNCCFAENVYLVPIPLGKKREFSRGYNQSELIAQSLSIEIGQPILTGDLIRIRETIPQSSTKNSEERKNNMKGCFSIIKPNSFSGENILLVDDVSTSGATFLEAALALKSAGAKKIYALAVCKA